MMLQNIFVDLGVNISASAIWEFISDVLACPNCGTTMVPNPEGKIVSANVYCDNCSTSFGMINSDKCPFCQTLFSN